MSKKFKKTALKNQQAAEKKEATKETVATETVKSEEPKKPAKVNGKPSWIRKVLTASSVGTLVLRIVILLAIPYAYLMLCGFMFEVVLKMYTSFASNFTFFSMIALFIAALVLIGFSIHWYSQSKKGQKK